MFVVLLTFLGACSGLLSGILMQYRGDGYIIFWMLFVALVALNGLTLFPIVSFDVDDQYISATKNSWMYILKFAMSLLLSMEKLH
jgi:hypothetical protein